jgi:hypothetical protein
MAAAEAHWVCLAPTAEAAVCSAWSEQPEAAAERPVCSERQAAPVVSAPADAAPQAAAVEPDVARQAGAAGPDVERRAVAARQGAAPRAAPAA